MIHQVLWDMQNRKSCHFSKTLHFMKNTKVNCCAHILRQSWHQMHIYVQVISCINVYRDIFKILNVNLTPSCLEIFELLKSSFGCQRKVVLFHPAPACMNPTMKKISIKLSFSPHYFWGVFGGLPIFIFLDMLYLHSECSILTPH